MCVKHEAAHVSNNDDDAKYEAEGGEVHGQAMIALRLFAQLRHLQSTSVLRGKYDGHNTQRQAAEDAGEHCVQGDHARRLSVCL